MEKLPEYKAYPMLGQNDVYDGNELRMEEVIKKINEIVEFIIKPPVQE
jgi:hypothetical protein